VPREAAGEGGAIPNRVRRHHTRRQRAMERFGFALRNTERRSGVWGKVGRLNRRSLLIRLRNLPADGHPAATPDLRPFMFARVMPRCISALPGLGDLVF